MLSSDYLLRDSAYRIYAHTKELVKREGAASLVITSHVPRATQSAKVIELAMPNVRISENAFLSHYYAGRPDRFIKSFVNSLPPYVDHVILVSHMMNISELVHSYVKRGSSLTLEADRWEDMFKTEVPRRQLNEYPTDAKGSEEIVAECHLSRQELEKLSSLPFIAD